jgi:hypothetical protein
LEGVEKTLIDKKKLIEHYEFAKEKYMQMQSYDEFELFATWFSIKQLYHKSIFSFDVVKLIKFICLPDNKIKFRGFFNENKGNYINLAKLIVKNFIKAYQLKSNISDIVSIFTEPSQGTIDVYEHSIINNPSTNSLSIVEFLDEKSTEGWEFITVMGISYFFRRKVNRT